MATVRISDNLTVSEGIAGHEAQKSSALVALILLLTFAGTVPTLAAPPPVTVSDLQPVNGANSVLVERTEGEFDGDSDGWRMNMDVWLQNNGVSNVVLETVEFSYDGGSNPGDSIVDVDFLTLLLGRGVIPENEDAGLAANEIEGFDTRVAFLPEQRVMPLPVPNAVTVGLYFEGYDDPITFTRSLTEYISGAPLDSYAFPGAHKDLPAGQYWYLGRSHTYTSHHRVSTSQRYAEDWAVARWDGDDWTNLVDSGDAGTNADHLIWNMPLYAIADGEVVRCGNGFLDNPNPPDILDGVTDDPPTIPGGGNHLWIEHVSGERVLYAHFRQGTIPEYLCPDDPSLGAHNVPSRPFVAAGEYLGRVGNSGSSSAPHLHIHSEASGTGIPLYYHNVRSFEEDHYDPGSDPAPPWNEVQDAAISSHDVLPAFGAFAQPRRRANVGIVKSFTPYPAVAGTTVTATLDITNHGPDAATGVEAVDMVPSELFYASDNGGCIESPAGNVTCDIGTLQALTAMGQEDSTSLQITLSIPANLVYANGGPVVTGSAASIAGDRFDDGVDNDFDYESTYIIAQADLSVESFQVLSAPPDTLIGEEAEVTVQAVVTSNGPSSPMHARLEWLGSAGGAAAVPTSPDILVPALEDDTEYEVTGTFTLSCTEPGSHTVDLAATIAPDSTQDEDPDASNNSAMTSLLIECVVPVAINVKPGSFPNSIRYGKGLVSIAILTTEAGEYDLPLAFDALTVDPLSVRFGDETLVWTGAGGASERHADGHVENSLELDEKTRDDDLDLVLDFRSAETGLTPASTEGCAKGVFEVGGQPYTFFGCDSVRVVDGMP